MNKPNSKALQVFETYHLKTITVNRTADIYGLSINEASRLINKGRLMYNRLAVEDRHTLELAREK